MKMKKLLTCVLILCFALLAFTGFLTAFMEPVKKFIDLGDTLQEMGTRLEQTEDVMNCPADVPEPTRTPSSARRPSPGSRDERATPPRGREPPRRFLRSRSSRRPPPRHAGSPCATPPPALRVLRPAGRRVSRSRCRARRASSVLFHRPLQDGDEGGLRHVHVAELLHARLAALLLLEHLHLARHVAAV